MLGSGSAHGEDPDTVAARPAAGAPPCPVRDPEDGACYATADDADRAWLARGGAAPRNPAFGPLASTSTVAASRPEEAVMGDEEDEDDVDEAEDGGPVAPVDGGASVDSARVLGELTGARKSPGFWRRLGTRVRNFVVRKSDSRPASLPEEELSALFTADFPMPVVGFDLGRLHDSFEASRGRHRRHHAIDLPAPRGTPVIAVVDGMIERLGRDRRGGKVCYLRDESGKYTFYYAHLSRHAAGLKVGDHVRRGDLIGEVGATGHATGPHLHFAIFREAEDGPTWRALVVNPYLIFGSVLPR